MSGLFKIKSKNLLKIALSKPNNVARNSQNCGGGVISRMVLVQNGSKSRKQKNNELYWFIRAS